MKAKSILSLVFVLSVSSVSSAFADLGGVIGGIVDGGGGGGWGPSIPIPPAPAPYPIPYPSADHLDRYLGQRLIGDGVLALRQILNISPEYRGRQIEYVVLRANTDLGAGTAVLTVNGQRIGSALTIGTYMQDYYFYPDSRDVIDDEISTLQIHLHGRFNIESVSVQFAPVY